MSAIICILLWPTCCELVLTKNPLSCLSCFNRVSHSTRPTGPTYQGSCSTLTWLSLGLRLEDSLAATGVDRVPWGDLSSDELPLLCSDLSAISRDFLVISGVTSIRSDDCTWLRGTVGLTVSGWKAGCELCCCVVTEVLLGTIDVCVVYSIWSPLLWCCFVLPDFIESDCLSAFLSEDACKNKA